MYEIADPNIYYSSQRSDSTTLQAVYHLRKDYTLLAFQESEFLRILAPKNLGTVCDQIWGSNFKAYIESFVCFENLKSLTRKPMNCRKSLQADWEKAHPKFKEEKLQRPAFEILELYEPEG